MMTLLAMPPGDISICAAILLLVGPGETGVPGALVGVETEVDILLVVGPGLTGA
jgi:CBS domain-containing protein